MSIRELSLMASLLLAAVFPAVAQPDGFVVKKVIAATETQDTLTPLDISRAVPYGAGFVLEGDNIFTCDNGADGHAVRGVTWSIDLSQRSAKPVRATAWACAEGAQDIADADFSLYLDLTYTDGSHLWGQYTPFDCGQAAGWHKREVVAFPSKPVKRVNFYLLFRNTAGQARFREPRFGEVEASGFDTLLTEPLAVPRRGFMLRDVGNSSDIVSINRAAMGIRLTASETRGAEGVTFYEVRLDSVQGGDRALTLFYTIPLAGADLKWFHDPRNAVDLTDSDSEAMNVSRHPVGSNGLLSRYPFGAVATEDTGHALGIDPDTPLFFRVGCQPQTRELFLACDIGLTPEKPAAVFRFCVFSFAAADGFRGALDRYYKIYPGAFETRVRQQGVWMPFAPISKIRGWEDFGFRFKEGDDETAWDDANDILTFRYTEPTTWWMGMDGTNQVTLERGRAQALKLAAAGDLAALAWKSSAFEDEQGRYAGRVMNTPWCTGVVWSVNSSPAVPGGAVTDYTNKMGPYYLKKAYDQAPPTALDGEYIDSAEAYVTEHLNFRRNHFADTQHPLCYALVSRKVGIYKGLIVFEYMRSVQQEMRKRGKYMMANSTPSDWFWLAPLSDVLGSETDWNHGGTWSPLSDADLLYRRALCKGKPYCFLMNTDFSKFTLAMTEKFMQRCLVYGMFPGFFSADAFTGHYFKQPELYNRDRHLFRKYIPLCRKVAEAGWEPLTKAASGDTGVVVERFGNLPGACYLTIFNRGKNRIETRITIALANVGETCLDLLNGREYSLGQDRSFQIGLDSEDVMLMELRPSL